MKKMVNKLEAKIMKKNYLFLIAASVALAFTACSTKELDLPEEKESGVAEEMKHVNLSATTENDNNTKVTLVGTTYGWSEGVDKLMVTTSNDGGSSYILTESSAFSDGHFTLDYAGRRDGYAVIPSTFLTGYDGSKLTITYPSSYDISSYITDGKYDAAGAYLPIPMIATSTEGDDNLKFYALGALVRVTVSDVPVGTKKLFITFNQTVTGNFTVTSPTPGTNSVAVADASTPSTVEFTISADGITSAQAANSFVLYIPVPTTTGLGIASSSKTKATVARNNGYAWAVNAITCTGDGSFATTLGKYVMAPGNLLAYNDGSKIVYDFLRGTDQLKHVWGDLSNPHSGEDVGAPVLASLAPYEYQDVFTWMELAQIVGDDLTTLGGIENLQNQIYNLTYFDSHTYYYLSPNQTTSDIDGYKWAVPSTTLMGTLISDYDYHRRNGSKAIVRNFIGVSAAKVLVDIPADNPYKKYANHKGWDSAPNTTIPGALVFPDGYVDQTDALTLVDYNSMYQSWSTNNNPGAFTDLIISYSAFEKIVAAGALFLPAVGAYQSDWGDANPKGWGHFGITALLYSDSAYKNGSTISCQGTNIPDRTPAFEGYRPLRRSCSVRLVREVVADGPSSSGEDRGAWGNLD